MAKKALLLLAIVFFLLVGSITLANGQDSASSLITSSSTELNFYGKENALPSSRNLTFVGLTDGVSVRLVASALYNNGSGESVAIKLNVTQDPFPVPRNEPVPVNVAFVSAAKAGTYEGTIIVIATSGENITTTILPVVATIQALNPWYYAGVQWGLIVIIGLLIFFALVFPEDTEIRFKRRTVLSKKIWVVGLGIIVAIIWLVSLASFPFGDPSTVITTILITPFLAYAIGIVKDKRTERLEREKVSRTIRDEGIKKDIDLIRNLMGEMSTHCASFNPNFYEEKMGKRPGFDARLRYQKTGLISREVWDKSCRQGFVADIHTLHLEKYYDVIPLYNQYYSHAMNRYKKNEYYKKNPKEDPFFKPFEEFRKKYSELQKVLFVYLSYILELYSKTTLAPMKLEFPRVTRTLLKRLIDYGVLEPFEFIDKLSRFKKKELAKQLENLGKKTLRARSPTEKLMRDLVLNAPSGEALIDKFNEMFKNKKDKKNKFKEDNPGLIRDDVAFNKGFRDVLKQIEEVEALEVAEEWVTSEFKERIEWWHFNADDLEKIVEDIYEKDKIPKFFRNFQNDFRDKYIELKKYIEKLPKADEMPKDSEVKEYKISLGNIYRKDEKDKKEEDGELKPDPLILDLTGHAELDVSKGQGPEEDGS